MVWFRSTGLVPVYWVTGSGGSLVADAGCDCGTVWSPTLYTFRRVGGWVSGTPIESDIFALDDIRLSFLQPYKSNVIMYMYSSPYIRELMKRCYLHKITCPLPKNCRTGAWCVVQGSASRYCRNNINRALGVGHNQG